MTALLLKRRNKKRPLAKLAAIISGRDFAFETTLSGRSYVPFLRLAKQKGYTIQLYFLWLPKVEISIERVAERVRMGGHNIPEETIRRRFDAGVRNLFRLYMPLADQTKIIDNSRGEPRLVATSSSGILSIQNELTFALIAAAGGVGP